MAHETREEQVSQFRAKASSALRVRVVIGRFRQRPVFATVRVALALVSRSRSEME